MAQMPIQTMSGRADPFAAAYPATVQGQPRAATPRASYVSDPGGISGGKLRPGSIDQEQFKAYLAAAQKQAVVAPPAQPAAAAATPPARGIPTLSPAQLAALGIDVSQLPPSRTSAPPLAAPETFATGAGAVMDAAIPDPTAADAAMADAALNDPALAADLALEQPSASAVADAALAEVAAARSDATVPQQAERGPIPGARRGADGVWELSRLPDKDERERLYGQKWRVVESEESRALFLGPDGEFGWDDFLDLINPLQHIPFVNMAYRAVTGDQIYGAARMVDVAFGPLAGASTAVDLAFRDVTGESMAENAIAAVFGPGDSTAGDAGSGDALAGEVSVNTASAQLADASPVRRGSNK
jgi:hypothetical protein